MPLHAMHTMKDLLVTQLNELHAAEKHCSTLLTSLADHASDRALAELLRSHGSETQEHLARLDAVFKELGLKPHVARAETACMKGLARDCLELAKAPRTEPHVRDAAIIAGVQHIEHDEIAGYGCARTWAQLLGFLGAAGKLQLTLDEERRADVDLSRIAQQVNRKAMSAATTV